MSEKLPSIVIPEGMWTDPLSDGQKDYVESLIDGFDLRGLDTRDRDMARHAIYHALLFGPRSKQEGVEAADEVSIRERKSTGYLSEEQRKYTEALLEQFEIRDLDERECDRTRQAIHYALMFGPHAKSDVTDAIDGITMWDGPWTKSLSREQQTYVEALADSFVSRGLGTTDRDIVRQAASHALLFGPRAEPVASEATAGAA